MALKYGNLGKKNGINFVILTLKAVGVYDYAPLITKMEFCSKVRILFKFQGNKIGPILISLRLSFLFATNQDRGRSCYYEI